VLAKPRDLDHDGEQDLFFSAPAANSPTLSNCGDVSIRKGHRFWLDAMPRVAAANTSVTLTTGQGIAGHPYALVLSDVNGAPYFIPIAFGFLDASGRGTLAGTVPPGLGAGTIGLQAFTLDVNGKLLASGVETLTTQ